MSVWFVVFVVLGFIVSSRRHGGKSGDYLRLTTPNSHLICSFCNAQTNPLFPISFVLPTLPSFLVGGGAQNKSASSSFGTGLSGFLLYTAYVLGCWEPHMSATVNNEQDEEQALQERYSEMRENMAKNSTTTPSY